MISLPLRDQELTLDAGKLGLNAVQERPQSTRQLLVPLADAARIKVVVLDRGTVRHDRPAVSAREAELGFRVTQVLVPAKLGLHVYRACALKARTEGSIHNFCCLKRENEAKIS